MDAYKEFSPALVCYSPPLVQRNEPIILSCINHIHVRPFLSNKSPEIADNIQRHIFFTSPAEADSPRVLSSVTGIKHDSIQLPLFHIPTEDPGNLQLLFFFADLLHISFTANVENITVLFFIAMKLHRINDIRLIIQRHCKLQTSFSKLFRSDRLDYASTENF